MPTGLNVTGTTSHQRHAVVDRLHRQRGRHRLPGATATAPRSGHLPTTTFTDTGLTAGTAYTYTVKARDAAGNVSAASTAVTATTTAGGGGTGSCTATYHVDNDWGAGFTATVTVTNNGTAPTASWQAAWTWAGNQQITNAWNATTTQTGKAVTAQSVGFNSVIAPGSSTTFGFQASYSGTNTAPTLTCTSV